MAVLRWLPAVANGGDEVEEVLRVLSFPQDQNMPIPQPHEPCPARPAPKWACDISAQSRTAWTFYGPGLRVMFSIAISNSFMSLYFRISSVMK
ncbi:hypothetical protein DY000_02021891 [Brassica cretica]|uniref:Uncharacterized protein n=1 Tax=Brassica cretica TaxID=69181 RepID=A0ABQ7EJ34_BRACR|nr:hypothetical protein DY000_02021891 [Brassica cretica]